MTVQEMALRNEVRQMMCEAGFNKETLKEEVKKLIKDVIAESVKQACAETNVESIVRQFIRNDAKSVIEKKIADEVFEGLRYRMKSADVNICIDGKWWKEGDSKAEGEDNK